MTPFHYAYLEINGEIEYFSFQNAKLEGKSKYVAAKKLQCRFGLPSQNEIRNVNKYKQILLILLFKF